jgi:two-component system CheB/CheR fusion protein
VWTRFSAAAIYDDQGRTLRLVCVIEDITERKNAERQQRMLMRELDHRVKNNLAAIMALAEQSIEASSSLEDFEKTFIDRVNAMARSHEALANAHWMGLDLDRALRATLAAHVQEKPPRVSLEGRPVKLDSRTVLPLCLAMHELATNAVRHGALATLDGHVDVTWTHEHGVLRIHWRESGGRAPDQHPAPGIGTTLIDGFIRYELRGKVSTQFTATGLDCTLEIPLTATSDGHADQPH